ncbi:MAG: ATP-binding cassette domain-containing protein [Pseudomonadota bacterium]
MVRLEKVVVQRGQSPLLGPVSLTLPGAGVTAVMGPNGAGKTTLMRVMHRLERPKSGRVSWERQLKQSFVFQRPVLLRRSVRENLALPLDLAGLSDAARVEAMAARLGLTGLLDAHAPRLSGGEAQKLALGRALITEPEVLFLDEPTANLDAPTVQDIEALLGEEAAKGTRLLISTHGARQARRLASEVVWVEGGVAHGPVPADAFFADPPANARAYLEAQT